MSSSIQERLQKVSSKLEEAAKRAARPHASIRLLAISKGKPIESILKAKEAGQSLFGESYMQEAIPKIESIRENKKALEWHFVGNLQSSKLKKFIGNFSLLHSLDKISLAKKLNQFAKERGEKIRALVQINIHEEKNKGGLLFKDIRPFLMESNKLDFLDIDGLMCIPKYEEQKKNPRKAFSFMRRSLEAINKASYYKREMKELSMGMSEDYEAGILEGSTIIRLGRAIFAEQDKKIK